MINHKEIKIQNRKNLNLNKVSYIHFNVIRIIHFLLLLFGLLLLQEPNAIMFELQQTIKLFELTYSLTDDLYIKQPNIQQQKTGDKYKNIFVSI